jgi:hypothetical protein
MAEKIEGVFIGRGLPKDPMPTYVNWGLVYLTANGNITTDKAESQDGVLYGIRVQPGKVQQLPTWDESKQKLKEVIASENFARLDLEQSINKWLGDGIAGEALYERVKKESGLLTLKDVGLEEETPAPENKAG